MRLGRSSVGVFDHAMIAKSGGGHQHHHDITITITKAQWTRRMPRMHGRRYRRQRDSAGEASAVTGLSRILPRHGPLLVATGRGRLSGVGY